MATSPINWANVTNGVVDNSGTKTSSTASGTSSLGSQDTFLKLLMAQVENQNPLNPTDGTQFVSELAQFSALEQNLATNTTLSSMKTDLDKLVSAVNGTTTSSSGNS